MAAIVERAAWGHVAGRAPSGDTQRGRPVSAVAAAPPPYASRPDLPLGDIRAGRGRFRNLDEDGHAIHRQLVTGVGLENPAANHSARPDRAWSELNESH